MTARQSQSVIEKSERDSHARARNPIGCRRGALGNGAGTTSFRATTYGADASGQRALTFRGPRSLARRLLVPAGLGAYRHRTDHDQIPRIFHGSELRVCVAFCSILPIRFQRRVKKPNESGLLWWAHKGSNLGPLPCEGNALPLSYAPGIFHARGD
jgi:hypothetical protein